MTTPVTAIIEDKIVLTRAVVNTKLLALKPFHIPKERIEIQPRRLGAGGFGEVKLATFVPNRTSSSKLPSTVAVKILEADRNSIIPLRLAYRLAREMIVWASCQHENILGFIGYFLSEDFSMSYLISPYMRNGNVRVFLEKNRVGTEDRLGLLRDATSGLQYLHTRIPPIVHGDLKSLNVLVNDHRRAVLCDFGLSTVMQDTSTGLTTGAGFQGSIRWASPEVITGNPRTLTSDMWGWGCLALEIMTGRIPFHDINHDTQIILQLCGNGTRRTPEPSDPPRLPEGLLHLLRGCWEFSPDLRPRVEICVDWLRPRTHVQRASPLKSATWIDSAVAEHIRVFEDVVHNWVELGWTDWRVARTLSQVSFLTPKELRSDLDLTQAKLLERSMSQDSNLKFKRYIQLREQVLKQELKHRSKGVSGVERRQSPSCQDPAAQLLQIFSTLRNPITLTRNQVGEKLKDIQTYLKPFVVPLDQERRLSSHLLGFEQLIRNFPDDRHPIVGQWLIEVQYSLYIGRGEYPFSLEVATEAVQRLRDPSKGNSTPLPQLASALEKAATSCELLGQYQEACSLLQEAIQVHRLLARGGTGQGQSERQIPLARTLWRYYQNLCRLGRGPTERDSEEVLREASKIYRSAVNFGNDGLKKFGLDLAGVLEDLCLLLRRQGKDTLASEEETRLSRVYERLDQRHTVRERGNDQTTG